MLQRKLGAAWTWIERNELQDLWLIRGGYIRGVRGYDKPILKVDSFPEWQGLRAGSAGRLLVTTAKALDATLAALGASGNWHPLALVVRMKPKKPMITNKAREM